MKSVKIANRVFFPIGFGTWSVGNSLSERSKEIRAQEQE